MNHNFIGTIKKGAKVLDKLTSEQKEKLMEVVAEKALSFPDGYEIKAVKKDRDSESH